MGWSEQYWEDVKSELAQLAAEPAASGADEALDQPDAGHAADAAETDDIRPPDSHDVTARAD